MKTVFFWCCIGMLVLFFGCSNAEPDERPENLPPFLTRYESGEDIARKHSGSGPGLKITVNTSSVSGNMAAENLASTYELIGGKYIYYNVNEINQLEKSPTSQNIHGLFAGLCNERGYAAFWDETEIIIEFEKGKPEQVVLEVAKLGYGFDSNGEKELPYGQRFMVQSNYPTNSDGTLKYRIRPLSSTLYPVDGPFQCCGIRLQCQWGEAVYEYLIPYLICLE
ncbi:MAG: hypothetical protein ACOX6U_00720 [Oscillospiraceae bacterium]